MKSKKQTLSNLVTLIAARLDDVSHVRWTSAEKQTAINAAIKAVWPRWNEIIDICPLADYDRETFTYALPEGVDGVVALYLKPNNSDDPWWLVKQWHIDGDLIYFHDTYSNYDDNEIRIVCVRAPWEFNTNDVTASNGVTTIDTGTFTSSGVTFQAHGVEAGDVLWLYSGCDADDKKKWVIKSVDSETQITVYGEFSASDTSITYYINYFTYVPDMYILHKAASELFQLSGHKGAGQDVSENMQWAEFHAQMAEYYIGLQGRPYPSKRTA